MPELIHDINLMPFHLSLLTLVFLSLVETVGYFLHIQPSQFFKRVIPQKLAEAPLLNVKFSKILILVFLLMNFSFSGYFLQFSYFAQQENFLPAYYVILPALIIAIFFTVFMIHCLDQVIRPTQIQLQSNLLGRLATISSGNARPGFSAQARVRDEYGQLHYVQVEPEFGELEFQSQIILIRIKHTHYIAKKISKSNELFSNDLHK